MQNTSQTQTTAPATVPSGPFLPDKPRPGVINLAQAIKQSRDTKGKEEALALSAEVLVRGLPDGQGGYGVVCQVKKFTGLESTQINFKARQAEEPDDQELFKVPEELSSADSRTQWWTDTWRLIYGCSDDTKAYLATIALQREATAAMFDVDVAHYWLKSKESAEVTDPLLQAIVILNYYTKEDVKSTAQLDPFKALPETLNQLITAYKGGSLMEFLQGNPDVVGVVTDNVNLLMELMEYVDDKKARRMARYFKDAAQQAIREVIAEWFEKDPPTPLNTMPLYNEEIKISDQEAMDAARLAATKPQVSIQSGGGHETPMIPGSVPVTD